MSKAYKDMDLSELSMERLRLKNILQNHPKPNTYKQSKKSLERVENLMATLVGRTLLNENKQN